MRPARRFDHAAALVERVEPGIGVGLQDALEVAQAPLRMLALPVRRELVEHRGRIGPAEWSVIAEIGPEPRRLGLPFPGESIGIGVSSAWTRGPARA